MVNQRIGIPWVHVYSDVFVPYFIVADCVSTFRHPEPSASTPVSNTRYALQSSHISLSCASFGDFGGYGGGGYGGYEQAGGDPQAGLSGCALPVPEGNDKV